MKANNLAATKRVKFSTSIWRQHCFDQKLRGGRKISNILKVKPRKSFPEKKRNYLREQRRENNNVVGVYNTMAKLIKHKVKTKSIQYMCGQVFYCCINSSSKPPLVKSWSILLLCERVCCWKTLPTWTFLVGAAAVWCHCDINHLFATS